MISIARNVERTGWLGLVRSFLRCSSPPPENDCYSELRPPSAGTPRRPPGDTAVRRCTRHAHGFAAAVPAAREGHYLFDLPGYITHRLKALGLAEVVSLQRDTYAEEVHFFRTRARPQSTSSDRS